MEVLRIDNLTVEVEGKRVLDGVSLSLESGKLYAVFGPNGSGKSSLLNTIMGLDRYRVVEGRILFKGEEITHLPPHERAKRGIGLGFQYPPEVKGVVLKDLLLRLSDGVDVEALARELGAEHLLEREVNVGFSGGERKKSELLQLLVQRPEVVLLDEPESGVDVENLAVMGRALGKLFEKDKHIVERRRTGLIITHTGHILDYLTVDRGLVMYGGRIICEGSPDEVLARIRRSGYDECVECFYSKVRRGFDGGI